jgi:hypothetical protein
VASWGSINPDAVSPILWLQAPIGARSKAAAGILGGLSSVDDLQQQNHFIAPGVVFTHAIRGSFQYFRLLANGSRLSPTVSPIGNCVGQLMSGRRPIRRLMRRSLTNSLANPRPSPGRCQPMGGAGSDRFCRSPRPFRLGAVPSRRSDTTRPSLKGDHTKTHPRRCKARTTSYDAVVLRCHALPCAAKCYVLLVSAPSCDPLARGFTPRVWPRRSAGRTTPQPCPGNCLKSSGHLGFIAPCHWPEASTAWYLSVPPSVQGRCRRPGPSALKIYPLPPRPPPRNVVSLSLVTSPWSLPFILAITSSESGHIPGLIALIYFA